MAHGSLIIDGYNLLHVTGIMGGGRGGRSSLERSRLALLNVLANSITSEQIAKTTVVFDAVNAPYNLPRTVVHEGITVRYAAREEDADSLIEALIKEHSSPRSLVVVSSDHRLHKAAKRRKATPIDSDQWYAELLKQRRERGEMKADGADKPQGPPSESEVQFWLEKFGAEGKQSKPRKGKKKSD